MTDPRLVRLVVSNLLSNAIKFTNHGTVRIGLETTDGFHVIEVADTGIGIADDDLGRLFQPFESLEPIASKSVPGLGLGLALVRQIAAALGGSVEVRSERDVGSIFRFRIPSRSSVNGA